MPANPTVKLMLKLTAALAVAATSVYAQPMSAADSAPIYEEIPLNTGDVPGMGPESTFAEFNGKLAYRNISRATLTPVLPGAGHENGAAVLVLPGGGFAMLAMENEGWPIAQWFADRGITAFIVKYRLNPTPTDEFDFQAEMNAIIAKIRNGEPMPELPTPPQAVEDGIAALRYVRLNAAEYGIDPSRIGMVGFSAGAMTSLEVIDNIPEEEQPAFIGSIYGPMKAREVPASAPPLFVVLAADDPIFGGKGFGIVEAWGDAGRPVEMHFYQQGGHGFGVGNPSLTSGDWMESFYHWLSMNGFVSSAATNP